MTKTSWNCKKCGALLGHWERRDNCGRHFEVLVTLAGPELIGSGRVPCACGAMRDWEPGRQSLEALLAMVQVPREH